MSITADFIILCGGQGTRLRSVVGESQKVLASVDDEPFLDLLIILQTLRVVLWHEGAR